MTQLSTGGAAAKPRAAAGAALLMLFLAGASSHAAAPSDGTSTAALVARGRYVATASDCFSCHTAKGGPPFAGGAALKSAFGTLYGPNITPDRQTGIGTWTRSDFERALRLGVDKEGSYLYPAMPYDAYTKMSAGDMDALWAYLRSLPPVRNVPPKNTLPFPFTLRRGLAVWQSMYFKPGPFEPVATKDARWNRGAYLVEALGHCGECHTPRNAAQAVEREHDLAGAQISGWYAPDISSDGSSMIRGWSTAELAGFLKSGVKPGNVKAVGPMQEAVHDSLRHLEKGDLEAMAVYLKDQPIMEPVAIDHAGVPAQRLAAGKLVYEDACASCHRDDGKGISGTVPALAGNDAVTAAEPYNVIMALLEGFEPQGAWGAMGSFAHSLTDDEIADVTNYVRTAWGNRSSPNATPWGVETWRKNASAANENAAAANDRSRALLCPNLDAEVVKPALNEGSDTLKRSATDPARLRKIIADYRSARPRASSAELLEALSTAYCRAVADGNPSVARMSAQLSDFAQKVASAIAEHGPAT